MGNGNFTGQPPATVLGGSPRKKRACQGASAHQVAGRGHPSQMGRSGGVRRKRWEDAHSGPLLGVATSRGTDKSKLGVQRPHAGLCGTEELGPKSPRPGQAASGGAPADAILKAKMAAPSKPVPRS